MLAGNRQQWENISLSKVDRHFIYQLYQFYKCLLQIGRVLLRSQESGVRSQNE
ncbi:MAG: hypothetical protein F6K48_18765 [Okeania sp. SIO3H1]|nr:hypothetical protein [Okeania sp. SIO3H1]